MPWKGDGRTYVLHLSFIPRQYAGSLVHTGTRALPFLTPLVAQKYARRAVLLLHPIALRRASAPIALTPSEDQCFLQRTQTEEGPVASTPA